MSQQTAFGDAELTTHIKVEKHDGTVVHYRVSGDATVRIDADTYHAEGGL